MVFWLVRTPRWALCLLFCQRLGHDSKNVVCIGNSCLCALTLRSELLSLLLGLKFNVLSFLDESLLVCPWTPHVMMSCFILVCTTRHIFLYQNMTNVLSAIFRIFQCIKETVVYLGLREANIGVFNNPDAYKSIWTGYYTCTCRISHYRCSKEVLKVKSMTSFYLAYCARGIVWSWCHIMGIVSKSGGSTVPPDEQNTAHSGGGQIKFFGMVGW